MGRVQNSCFSSAFVSQISFSAAHAVIKLTNIFLSCYKTFKRGGALDVRGGLQSPVSSSAIITPVLEKERKKNG